MKKNLTWVHLSDLHFGHGGQWLWPNFRDIFLKDIKRLSEKIEQIDLVIFSGDLTYSGKKDEFQGLTNELQQLWEIWDKLNIKPKLFTVPGNHDLVRPKPNNAQTKILTKWGEDTSVIKEFWEEADNQYSALLQESFRNYETWRNDLLSAGIPYVPHVKGIVPGDISSSLEINEIPIGLIGLNSSFLQLNGDDFNGKLVLSGRQLNAVTDNDPPKWIKKHKINFLVTHHPTSWLSPEAQKEFNGEIYPSGRFMAHFYGHMHEPDLKNTSYGGHTPKRTCQAASLFGMEYLKDGKTIRAHGYSFGRVSYEDDDLTWQMWPRKGIQNNSGDPKVIPDHENFEIVDGEEYQFEKLQSIVSSVSTPLASKVNLDLSKTVEESNPQWERALASCLFPLIEQEQHLAIRPLEQQIFIESSNQKGMVWVCADWGSGREGFIWSVLKKTGKDLQPVYKVSLSDYESREDFQSKFSTYAGCSFPEFCKALASAGPALLLFDDVPVTIGEAKALPIERDVENLAGVIKDFCPEIEMVLFTRSKPQFNTLNAVSLEPLDEVDTKVYLEAHPSATSETKSAHAVNLIFRCTDGLPGKIDSTLKTLRVIPLSELEPAQLTNSADYPASVETVPLSLIKAVTTLSESNDPLSKRAYLLLKTLSILPQGESLARLKRIDNRSPIFPKHATELLDNDLIQVRSSATFISVGGEESQMKILLAPRQVRDYVLLQMTAREIDTLAKKAITLYFGENWRTGHATLKKVEKGLISDDGSLMENPHNIVMRLLKNSISSQDAHSLSSVLNLCLVYCNALHVGKHYRNCVNVCRDILSIIPKEKAEVIKTLNLLLAKSLRMTDDMHEALPILEKLIEGEQSNMDRCETCLVYAMGLQELNDKKAIDMAKQVIALQPKSGMALQAKAIIIEMNNGPNASAELLKLEKKARASKFDLVANNLTLTRVSNSSDYESLRVVYDSATKAGDAYTVARAAVRLGALIVKDTGTLPPKDLTTLISAYQFCYGERFISLFSKAHNALWEYFEKKNDVKNLLTLFRHSSFIWRLNGEEDKEQKYIHSLTSMARNILTTDILKADRNTSYFLLRARNEKTVLGKSKDED